MEIVKNVSIPDIECPNCGHLFDDTFEVTIDWEPDY